MPFLLTTLPDDIIAWRGTAAELADKCNELLPAVGLETDVGSLNERLVRYYVSEEVLTPPAREGREAMFGFRQVIELLVIRYLLRDEWPLAKIGDLVRSADLAALQNLMPTDRPRTAAEEALARIKGAPLAVAESRDRYSARRPKSVALSLGPLPAHRMAPRTAAPETPMPESASRPALEMAAELTRRKSALHDNLRALGNSTGRPERRRTLRIALTPWCEVLVDAGQLQSMGEGTPEILGTALTQALQDERLKRGEKP